MGRRRRWKSKGLSAPVTSTDADPVTRSISVIDGKVAIAAGRRWRVVDVSSQTELHTDTSHEGAVRDIKFSNDGQYVLTCGDDKTARSWRTADWNCLRILQSAKKASACAFSEDGQHVFFSDRFGDVLVATTVTSAAAEAESGEQLKPEEPNLLLGHLQAIITSLTTGVSTSSGQPLIVSTDRDGKVRASVLPKDPTKGSYDIQSYCLGHTGFVTCSAAVPAAAGVSSSSSLLLSGSGDGTVRLWNVDTGKQLACYVAAEAPTQQEQQQHEQQQQQQQHEEQQQRQSAQAAAEPVAGAGNGSDGDSSDSESEEGDAAGGETTEGASTKQFGRPYKRLECAAVLSLAVSPDGSLVAAAVERQQEVQILQLQQDVAQGGYSLQPLQKLQFEDVANPAAVAFDSQGRLWVVGGVLLLETESAHVGVAARGSQGGEFWSVTAEVLPDSLRAYLECRVAAEEEGQAGQAVGSYYHDGFKRKVYTQETLDERKKIRTDHREGERLKAMWAAEEQQQQANQPAAEAAAEQQQ